MDNINHSDTPGEEGELAKDDVLGGPTENTIEDEVNQEGVEAGLGSIFSRYFGIQLATEVLVLNISTVVTLRGRNTEPIELLDGILPSGISLASTKLDSALLLSSFSTPKTLEDLVPPAIRIKCTLKFATLCNKRM